MPIYEYRCADCGKINEFFEFTGKNETEKRCKYCGSNRLNKIFSEFYAVSGRGIISSQRGKTCCGRDERCEKPPCSDDGRCMR